MKRILLSCALTLLISTLSAKQDNLISYNTVDLGYNHFQHSSDQKVQTISSDFSIALNDHIYLSAGYESYDDDIEYINNRYNYKLNVGYKYSLESLDLYSEVGYIKSSTEISIESIDYHKTSRAESYIALAGIRTMLSDNIEFDGNIAHANSKSRNGTVINLETRYHLNQAWSLGLRFYSNDRETQGLGVTARYSF